MASSSADCVFGGVRLTSSASSTLVNTGPASKRQRRSPDAGSSSRMSVPVTSAGMRSGVNWMRLKSRPRAWASARTIRVLAVPGNPVIRQCPPTRTVIRSCSMTASWPTMTRPSAVAIRAMVSRNPSTAASAPVSSASVGAGSGPGAVSSFILRSRAAGTGPRETAARSPARIAHAAELPRPARAPGRLAPRGTGHPPGRAAAATGTPGTR